MKKFLLLLSMVLAGVVATQAGPTVNLSASNAAFHSSSTCSGETANSGPSPNTAGYVGSVSFDYSVSGSGSGFVNYSVVYAVDAYNSSTSSWSRVGYTHSALKNYVGDSGTKMIDLYVDPATFPSGSYAISAWVYTLDTSGNLKTCLTSSVGQYVMAYDDPLPEPEPSPGPPDGGPPPTGGPVGPGSSICG